MIDYSLLSVEFKTKISYIKANRKKIHVQIWLTFLACIPNSTSSPNMSSLILPLNSL